MILWVRNLGRAQLGSSSVPPGVDVSHMLVFMWLVWSGRSKMTLLICQSLGRDSWKALEGSGRPGPSQESDFLLGGSEVPE